MKGNEGMKTKRCRKVWCTAFLVLMLTAMMLQVCGGGSKKSTEDWLKEMKEFSTPDGVTSLYLKQSWITQDLGSDTSLAAGEENGSEAVLLLSFPKTGLYQVDSMDSLKSYMESNYQAKDAEPVEEFDVPGMSNVEALTCNISMGGQSAQACLVYGETDYAYYSIGYVAQKINDRMISSFKASCSKFHEEVTEAEDRTTVELTDTVKWFNASYAILTEINGGDYNRFAGTPANDDSMAVNKQSLEEWWSVTDRASADETLDWILTEGHRTGFADNMKSLEESGIGQVSAEERVSYILENFDVSQEEAQGYADNYAVYEQYGEHALDGWDYCRAMNLMSFYYLAGYYTEEEALNKSLEIAQTMQPLFESWDALIESYMLGYEYWAEESSSERRAVYEELKTRDDNPYQVDYHTALEKTW